MKRLGHTAIVFAVFLAPLAKAVVDLDAVSPTIPQFARETLQSRATTESSSSGDVFYNVADAGTDIDVRTVLGVPISAGGRAYVRIQLRNAVFAPGNNAALTVNGSDSDVSFVFGGAIGDDFIIYSLNPPGGLSSGDTVDFVLDTVAISSQGPASLTYTTYETLTAAIFQQAFLYQNTASNYIRTVEGASPVITFGSNTADVDAGYLAFTTSSVGRTRANVGTLSYEVNAIAKSAISGNTVTLPEIVNETASDVELSGDFSFGSWYLDNNADCTSPDFDLTDAIALGDGSQLTTSLVSFGSNELTNLCVTVDDESKEIQADEYRASSMPMAASNFSLFDPVFIDGNLGVIDRNGTEVNLPSLTTFGDYQQRISIANYRDFPVDYALEFIPESGVTVTALELATGTLAPRQKLVLRVQDVVLIEGGTRCAATLAARVREGSIGVSTTQINLADGSTDTVVYE